MIRTVGKRCLVFCLCENKIGSVIRYSAFINGRIVPVLLNAHLDRSLLDNLLKTYHPEYLWVPKEQANDFDLFESVTEMQGYTLLKTNYLIDYTLYPDLALLLTTSGSTGSPKFVHQSYRNIEANANSIIEYLKLDESERAITTLPMNYTYGLSIISTHLMVGATLLLTDKGLMQKELSGKNL